MPSVELQGRKQTATLWTFTGAYNGDGEPTVNTPVEILVRWEFVSRQLLSPTGSPIQVDAEVMVDRAIAVGSILWLGALADVADPPVDLYEVLSYDETPDIKGRKYQRNVSLRKTNTSLTLAS